MKPIELQIDKENFFNFCLMVISMQEIYKDNITLEKAKETIFKKTNKMFLKYGELYKPFALDAKSEFMALIEKE